MKDGSQIENASRPALENMPFPSEFNPQQPKKAKTQAQLDSAAALEESFRRALEEL